VKRIWRTGLALLVCQIALVLAADKEPAVAEDKGPICNRVRFFPSPDGEKAMVGGKFTGSNLSQGNGFQLLGEIKTAPPTGKWTELTFPNQNIYRWIRYEAPAGSHGNVAEVEFYSGERKLAGAGYGSAGERDGRSWSKALDGDTSTWFDSDKANNQYVGLDLGEKVIVTKPTLTPGPGEFKASVQVAIKCNTPDSAIRYTLDGTIPGPEEGLLYTAPLKLNKPTTLVAVAFKKGLATSQPASGTYLVGLLPPGLNTFHIGNSLTNTTSQFPTFVRTAGTVHNYQSFTAGGALTKKLWDVDLAQRMENWDKLLAGMPRIDHFTAQPRDFKIEEEADYDIRFFNLIRKHTPDFQPWLYCEWVEKERQRPTDKGTVPSSQMKPVPALTWEESMAAMLLYVEELQLKIGDSYKEGKRPRVIPSAIAMGWIKNKIDQGKFPGAEPGSFYPLLFSDGVHPNVKGGYLVDLTWYAAFYRQSPEGQVLPVGTGLTAEQAAVMQRLAWDVVKNYPDCGLYQEGTTPAGKPEFSPAPAEVKGVTAVTLSSATPGAWFRYTLDGTIPTRTRGYVYCGVVSVRPGMTLKAVAYKSGLANSPVTEAAYAPTKGKE
jgi:Chitobiase/beta-hexosaminidase C-terminal domain